MTPKYKEKMMKEETKKCDLCKKKVLKTTRCKVPNPEGYELVLNVCDECMKKENLTEYDGSDVYSDWN